MNRLPLLLAALLALVTPSFAAPKPKATPIPVDPFIKSTVWPGKITAIDPTSITVTNAKGLKRKFLIYSGTVLGRGGTATLGDFQVGGTVTVSFSEEAGSKVAKAENISLPKAPKAGAPGKKVP